MSAADRSHLLSDITKVTVNPPTVVVESLRALAGDNNMSMTDAMLHSIMLNKYLSDQQRANSRVLIEAPNGMLTPIVRK